MEQSLIALGDLGQSCTLVQDLLVQQSAHPHQDEQRDHDEPDPDEAVTPEPIAHFSLHSAGLPTFHPTKQRERVVKGVNMV